MSPFRRNTLLEVEVVELDAHGFFDPLCTPLAARCGIGSEGSWGGGVRIWQITSGDRHRVRYACPSSEGSAMPLGAVRLLSVNCHQHIPTWPKELVGIVKISRGW